MQLMFAGDLIHVVANRSFQAHNTEYADIHTKRNVSFIYASHSHTFSISMYLQSQQV